MANVIIVSSVKVENLSKSLKFFVLIPKPSLVEPIISPEIAPIMPFILIPPQFLIIDIVKKNKFNKLKK